eukprot:2192665-Rhodomonas_salina.2
MRGHAPHLLNHVQVESPVLVVRVPVEFAVQQHTRAQYQQKRRTLAERLYPFAVGTLADTLKGRLFTPSWYSAVT